MKTAVQLSLSFMASASMLVGLASHATPAATGLAEKPLKASVLAKPNVIFGMDDSGSMDWETLLNTVQGMAYWNGTTAWNSTTNQPLNSDGTTSTSPIGYLFNVGTASGGALVNNSNYYGAVAPPTSQFAWLRSWRFNPLYYNPAITYKPWSPAYVNGANATYADASITAATAHPAVSGAPTLALTTDWNETASNWTTVSMGFRVYGGMVLPSGSRVEVAKGGVLCAKGSGAAPLTLMAETTMPAGVGCRASMPYYPATYWQPTVCPTGDATCVAAPDCTASTAAAADCVASPDGVGKLRRYEIRSTVTSYPGGRTYAQEIQNFANWFSYHRKRKLMLAGSMGQVLENLTGLRLGVVRFNANTTVGMMDADATAASNNRFAVAGKFYLNAMSFDDTPTLATLKHIGTQVDTDTNIVQYACQRNNAFVVTDGFANDMGVAAPDYDRTTYGTGSPYATTTAGSLADLALAYYTRRLRGTDTSALTAGLVPASSSTAPGADRNTNLHLNTYAISLGLTGSVWTPNLDPYAATMAWPTPVSNTISMIDDLFHATINGRGKMYLATSPTETVRSITAGLNDILNHTGAQTGVSVSSVNLSRGDGFAYMGRYNPAGWVGDVTANTINAATGVISTSPTWSASSLLTAKPWDERQIAAQTTGGGVAFDETHVGSLVNASATWGVTADLVNYLRGDRSLEGSTFRTRSSLLGAVINAEPVISRDDNIVFVASGEGLLHAFDITPGDNAGQELWALAPRAVLADLGSTSARNYAFKTQLDGTPVIGKSSSTGKLLVAGMGAAGRSYYAVDVTTPRDNTAANASSWVKWEFPGASDTTNQGKVGQTVGRPALVKTAAGYRVLVTSGYNPSADGKGRLFVLDPADGSVLKEYVTTDDTTDTEAGLAHIAPYAEDDGTVRYVYGGDLQGNLWRFDLDATGTGPFSPNKVAALKDGSNRAQPITAAPELMEVSGQRVVLVGTGRMLDVTDWGNNNTQTFYAIADGATLPNARSNLVRQVYTHTGDSLTTTEVNWTTGRGWYIDLPTGEHANTRPALAYGAVAFTTNVAGATDCSASSYFYVIDVATGGKSANVSYVSSQISATANASAPTAVITSNGDARGLAQTSEGQPVEKVIASKPNIPASKNAWREVHTTQ